MCVGHRYNMYVYVWICVCGHVYIYVHGCVWGHMCTLYVCVWICMRRYRSSVYVYAWIYVVYMLLSSCSHLSWINVNSLNRKPWSLMHFNLQWFFPFLRIQFILQLLLWKKKWVGESVTYVLRALFRGILWPTWMSICFWYLWSELRVGGVRGDYNIYIQVQSPLSGFSLNCVIMETRPLFFLLQNFR